MSMQVSATTVEPFDEPGSAVRFESQCIVIPDSVHRSRRPRVVTKSYTLPLWKRRTSSVGSLPSNIPSEEATCEDNSSHLVLRFPLPTISLKSHVARPADHSPLPPCLVHRPQPSSPNRHPRPRKVSPSPSRSDIVTVPLRPCCAACQPVTDAARIDADAWPEHFSRAASRRRSLSTDNNPCTLTVAGSAASASYGSLGVEIRVDEIDRRRRASDLGPSTTGWDFWPESTTDEGRPSLALPRAAMSNPNACYPDARTPSSPSRTSATPATPRIPEEEDDEDANELFPLPSPKRTPSASPAPSLTGSLSSLVICSSNHYRAHGQHQGSGTSPTPSACSGESTTPVCKDLLAPPLCASSSSLSLPRLPGSMTDLSAEDLPRVPSPSLLSAHPSISARRRSPSPGVADGPSEAANPVLPAPAPASVQQPLTGSPRSPWRAKRAGDTQTPAPDASPTPHPKRFSMPSPLQMFTDVLRGVGTMGTGGMSGM